MSLAAWRMSEEAVFTAVSTSPPSRFMGAMRAACTSLGTRDLRRRRNWFGLVIMRMQSRQARLVGGGSPTSGARGSLLQQEFSD
jgi:hypothetical protein